MAKWVTLSSTGARYLIQDPDEVAATLNRAFPTEDIPLQGEVYAVQMLRDHPMPPEFAQPGQSEEQSPPGI